MPKIVDRGAKRGAIRDAARRVFARRGIAQTGLVQVAEAAGMGRSSLYHYYPDKEALVRDLLRDVLEGERALFLEAAQSPGRPLDKIERLVSQLTGLFEEWRAVGALLLELRHRDARAFRPFFRRIRAELAGIVREGQSNGEIDASADADLASATVIGVIDGLLLQYFVDPRAFPAPDALSASAARSVRRLLAP